MELDFSKIDLYAETIHHHDRTYIRIYRDYLALFQSPIKAAIVRLLESARGAEVVAFSSLFTLLRTTFDLNEPTLKKHLHELVEQGYVTSRYNGINRTYQINAPAVQAALDGMQEAQHES